MADKPRTKKINTKKKFIADGVFQAELNEFLSKTLGQEGYAGLEVRCTSFNTEIRVRCTNSKNVLDKKVRMMKEIKSCIMKRYGFQDENELVMVYKPLNYHENLCAAANVEILKSKLLNGTPVRMAANNILGNVMRRGGAIGCEVIIAGKVRGQRAKAQKYAQGYQISTGHPKYEFIDIAIRNIKLRQGVLGLRVKIMQGTKIKTANGDEKVMPDFIQINNPKDDEDRIVTPEVLKVNQDAGNNNQ